MNVNDNSQSLVNLSSSVSIIADAEVAEIINSNLSDKNAQYIKTVVKTKRDQYDSYFRKFINTKSMQRKVNITLTVIYYLFLLTGIIYNFCIDADITSNNIIPEILILISMILHMTHIGLIQIYYANCIIRYTKLCTDLKDGIDKVYLLWQKAIISGSISDDELTDFKSIFEANNKTVTEDEKQNTFNISGDFITALTNLIATEINKFKT